MIKRESYLEQLRQTKDHHLIKVITGIRRCGKSTVMEMFRDELKENGIAESRIFYFNLEEKENFNFTQDPDALYNLIIDMCDKNQTNYVFLDEVQMVPEFERMIDSLFVKNYIDLYITGSNAFISGGELATLLTGRYYEIKMLPLSFAEFKKFYSKNTPKTEIFSDFMQYGGFPEVANFSKTGTTLPIRNYLRGIFDTILEKDIAPRGKVRSMEDFRKITEFLFDNIGSLASPNSLTNTINQDSAEIDRKTVDNYITLLSQCFTIYEAQRYDIRGKEKLKTLKKYYSVDIGLSSAVLGETQKENRGHRLENLVYLELLRRSDDVCVGKNLEKEVDFRTKSEKGEIKYYQVALSTYDETVLEREIAPLRNLSDANERTILTLDDIEINIEGVKIRNIIDWLLETPYQA